MFATNHHRNRIQMIFKALKFMSATISVNEEELLWFVLNAKQGSFLLFLEIWSFIATRNLDITRNWNEIINISIFRNNFSISKTTIQSENNGYIEVTWTILQNSLVWNSTLELEILLQKKVITMDGKYRTLLHCNSLDDYKSSMIFCANTCGRIICLCF